MSNRYSMVTMLGDKIYGSDIIKMAIEHDWRGHKTEYEEFEKSRLEEIRKEWRSNLKPSFEDKYDEETLKQMFRDKLSKSEYPFVEKLMEELKRDFNKPKEIDYLEYISKNLQEAFDEYYHDCLNGYEGIYDKFLEDLRREHENNESYTQLSFEEYCKNYVDDDIFWKYVDTIDSCELYGEKFGPFDVNEIDCGEYAIGFDIPLVHESSSSEISIIDISELNDLYKDKLEIFKKYFNKEPKIISFVFVRY